MGRALVNRGTTEVTIPQTAEVGSRGVVNRVTATRQKSSKSLKREAVIPFHGEEQFIVPKRGGFGQPDNEHYVMVSGGTTIGKAVTTPIVVTNLPSDAPASTSVSTSNVPPITTITPPVIDTPTTPPPSTTTTPVVVDTPTQAETDCIARGGAWINGACVIANQPAHTPVSEMPTFPDFSAMDCASLGVQISSIQSTMATGFFTTEVANAYNNALASANSLFNTRCHTTTPPTTLIPVIPIGGAFMGGGGGGFVSAPTDQVAPIEEPQSNKKSIFIILGIIGIIYFLTRKK